MPYRVAKVNEDGTASVTATVPDDYETAAAHAAQHGGEVLSAAVVVAIQRRGQPAAGGVPVAEFKRRLAPMYYALGTRDEITQRRWDRVLALLDSFGVIYPTQSPVSDLILAARAEGLLTAPQAAALAA